MRFLPYALVCTTLFFISSCKKDVEGCIDSQACNYNPLATINNNCEYPQEGYDCDDVFGCSDSLACNYNPEAIMVGEMCVYLEVGFDCDGLVSAEIGDSLGGGYLFYLDATGEHGLVAAYEDLAGAYEWGCFGSELFGAEAVSIGGGYQNTLDIVGGCSETPIAASVALEYESEGFDDWYLPSKNELLQMHVNIGNGGTVRNIGGFSNDWYWSSSEDGNNLAWYVNFENGYTYYFGKRNAHKVRPIRSF